MVNEKVGAWSLTGDRPSLDYDLGWSSLWDIGIILKLCPDNPFPHIVEAVLFSPGSALWGSEMVRWLWLGVQGKRSLTAQDLTGFPLPFLSLMNLQVFPWKTLTHLVPLYSFIYHMLLNASYVPVMILHIGFGTSHLQYF